LLVGIPQRPPVRVARCACVDAVSLACQFVVNIAPVVATQRQSAIDEQDASNHAMVEVVRYAALP